MSRVPSQCFDEVVELVRFPYGVHRIDDLVEALAAGASAHHIAGCEHQQYPHSILL